MSRKNKHQVSSAGGPGRHSPAAAMT
jgi:hypothetical protein